MSQSPTRISRLGRSLELLVLRIRQHQAAGSGDSIPRLCLRC